MLRVCPSLLLALLVTPLAGLAASPYASQTSRPIKALSDDEIADYLSGKGMGFAKAAELNGYPGPKHVLEFRTQLELSPAQREKTAAIFERMQGRARAAGTRLIGEERRLDQLFAAKTISPRPLHRTVASIWSLQSQIREIHLAAHLEQANVLTATQTMRYWHLRGYGDGDAPHHHAR